MFQARNAQHSLKSPACSCVSITLPASSSTRITAVIQVLDNSFRATFGRISRSTQARAANEFSMTRSHAWPKRKRETATPEMTQRLLHAMSRQRKYQLRHERAGLCCDCSRPATSGTLFCELHRRKRNLENREKQRERFQRKIRYLKAESYRFTGSNAYVIRDPGV